MQIFRKKNKIEREYSYEEMLQIHTRTRRIYIAIAACIALSIIFYLSWIEVSQKIKAGNQIRIFTEKLIDIRLQSITKKRSTSISLNPEGSWLLQEHPAKKTCEGGEKKIFFKNTENIFWEVFLIKKEDKIQDTVRIDSFCLDIQNGVMVENKILDSSDFLSVNGYLKKEEQLEKVQKILIKKNGANIYIRDF